MERSIIHLNIADFAVAVERTLDRRLRDRPVVIAPAGTGRAAVYDMSEEAYRAGIRKGMPLRRALSLCRDARLLPPHPDRYERAMRALLGQALPYSPLVESGETDGHLFIDVTGTSRLWGPPVDVAWRLRRQTRTDLGLDPVWSLAPNKLVAKVATRLVKPDGEYIVAAGEEAAFLAPLPVFLLPGVERGDLRRLREFNLSHVFQVAALSLEQLQVPFGARARMLYETVRGIDSSPVLPAGQKSPRITAAHEFGRDTHAAPAVEAALYRLAEQIGAELRQRRRAAGRLGLILDYTDGVRCARRVAARPATADDRRLFELARRALAAAWHRRVRIRHLHLVCDRVLYPPVQLELFADQQQRKTRQVHLMDTIDRIRRRFGREAIRVGRTMKGKCAKVPKVSVRLRRHQPTNRLKGLRDSTSTMIPLTVKSSYSLMWGTAPVEGLARRARKLGYRRLALTDTDNLYGLWPFLAACRREGITPIVGAEVTDPAGKKRAVCLVEDDDGYRNLCRLLTRRHTDENFRLENALPALGKGLVILTTDGGLLTAAHEAGLTAAAAMPRRPLPAGHRLCRTARKLGVPLAATPGSFFLQPADFAVHRLLRAIERNTNPSRLAPGDTAPADAWLASPAVYTRRFAACPQALEATVTIAERLAFTGPRFGVVMPPLPGREADAAARLRRAAYAGARRRYGRELAEAVVERLEHELRIITQMGFAAYFLIVRDIVRYSPRTCGRGSGAASLVAYCLGITNVCPLKHNLYFERFLNPGRTDPPDIDVDFAWDERDTVLQRVLGKYRGHAAMVCNHVLFRPRMAIREVAKVHGLPEVEINRTSRWLPWHGHTQVPGADFSSRRHRLPATRDLDLPEPWPEIIAGAARIIGIPRYLSVHPGGVVITPRPIDEYVPVQRAPKGVPVIQWEKDGTEEAGLVKIDLLGNRSLGVIRDALAGLRANGITLDESRWEPEDDFATQQTVAQGRTMGCFYIESPAMRLLQQKSRVGDFEHLVIHSSIIRPAANEFIREYIRRLHGGRWDPIHPRLADVLEETFGIMVYQEDVSRAAVALAGFSHAEADALRKVLSKKDRRWRLGDFQKRFYAGAWARGVPQDCIDAVWQMMMSFDGYSFCKPHSASYARVSFQAAYLKVHHPAEFMAAVISNQGGFYSTFAYVSEARRLGLTILPPDVNRSDDGWTGKKDTLRVGLMAVKGLSEKCRRRIVSGRRSGPYRSVRDFLDRVRPDEDEAQALVHSGALDGLHPEANRATLLWEVAARLKPRRPKAAGETIPLFDCAGAAADVPAPRLPPEDELERRRREFAALGFLCDRHPMELYAHALQGARTVKAAQLPQHIGKRVRLAGWLITGKVVTTKHGDPMEFLTFEDETGLVETTFFPRAFRRFCHMIDRRQPYLLTGKVEEDWGAVTLTVDGVERIKQWAPAAMGTAVGPADSCALS